MKQAHERQESLPGWRRGVEGEWEGGYRPGDRPVCSKNEGAAHRVLQGGTGSPARGRDRQQQSTSHWILGESSSFWEACKFLSPGTKSGG